MSNPQKLQMQVVWVLVTTALIALTSFVIILLNIRTKDQMALEQSRATVRDLRAQVDERTRTISELKASVDRLQTTIDATSPRSTASQPDASLNAISQLSRRLLDMGSTQMQILALMEKVAAKTAAPDVPSSTPGTTRRSSRFGTSPDGA